MVEIQWSRSIRSDWGPKRYRVKDDYKFTPVDWEDGDFC